MLLTYAIERERSMLLMIFTLCLSEVPKRKADGILDMNVFPLRSLFSRLNKLIRCLSLEQLARCQQLSSQFMISSYKFTVSSISAATVSIKISLKSFEGLPMSPALRSDATYPVRESSLFVKMVTLVYQIFFLVFCIIYYPCWTYSWVAREFTAILVPHEFVCVVCRPRSASSRRIQLNILMG